MGAFKDYFAVRNQLDWPQEGHYPDPSPLLFETLDEYLTKIENWIGRLEGDIERLSARVKTGEQSR